MSEMDAAILYGPEDVRIERVPIPPVGPGRSEIASVFWPVVCRTKLLNGGGGTSANAGKSASEPAQQPTQQPSPGQRRAGKQTDTKGGECYGQTGRRHDRPRGGASRRRSPQGSPGR